MNICDTTRTKVWLKTFGTLKEDGWWSIPSSPRLMSVLNWELLPEDWIQSKKGNLQILLDWDGDISELDPNLVMKEMTILGQCKGHTGWIPLKRLSDKDQIFVMFKLPSYHTMIV